MLSHEYLKTILKYEPDTGVFTWLVWRPSYAGKVFPGAIVRNLNSHGYSRIGIDGVRYQAHRLAWFYVNGTWPVNQIDHINRNRSDNRIANLREATDAENRHNTSLSVTNKSGFKGVTWDKQRGKWFAKITHNYKQIPLGRYESLSDAATAYASAKLSFHSFNPEP